MISIDIVLMAIMVIQNPTTQIYELQYRPLDYFKSMTTCNIEKIRLQNKPDKGISYVCLKVYRN